jgi:hypothetical protein
VITAEATTVVHCGAQDVLDCVADLPRYRQANTKIGDLVAASDDGRELLVTYRARPLGLPLPVRRQRISVGSCGCVEPGCVELTDVPSRRPRMLAFSASLQLRPAGREETRIVHRATIWCRGPLAPLLERMLCSWLANDVAAETERLTAVVDRPRPMTHSRPRPR